MSLIVLLKRNHSIDSIKFFCILGVICIHTRPFISIGKEIEWIRYLGLVINTVCRVCVPLFFISSGYLFYKKCNKKYIKKYLINLIKILTIWIIVYITYDMFNIIDFRNGIGNFKTIKKYFTGFKIMDIYYANGIIKYHLWYLSSMIVTIPIMYIIKERNIINKALKITVTLNLIGVIIPVLNSNLSIKFRDCIFFSLFYCTLGLYIKQNEEKLEFIINSINDYKYTLFIIILFIIQVLERAIYLKIFNGCGDYYITTIPLSILIFGLCIRNKSMLEGSLINRIGQNTLGIYLIHLLIMDIISSLLIKSNLEFILDTVMWQILYTPVVLIISYIVYENIKKYKNTLTQHNINKFRPYSHIDD